MNGFIVIVIFFVGIFVAILVNEGLEKLNDIFSQKTKTRLGKIFVIALSGIIVVVFLAFVLMISNLLLKTLQ